MSFAFEFAYPVPGKRMVCFVIEYNGKTNHKFPVNGIRKFERKGNSLYRKRLIFTRVPVVLECELGSTRARG